MCAPSFRMCWHTGKWGEIALSFSLSLVRLSFTHKGWVDIFVASAACTHRASERCKAMEQKNRWNND